jgi:hypothetical protein
VIGGPAARGLHEAVEREAVGVEDLTGLPLVARLNHLIAGGQDRDPRLLSHQQLR